MRHEVTRDGQPTLEFEGEEIAFVSSARPGKPYWTEITLWRTNTGKYVVQSIGRANDPQYPDRCDLTTAKIFDTAREFIAGSRHRNRKGEEVTNTLWLSLAEHAADQDSYIDAALAAVEQTKERI